MVCRSRASTAPAGYAAPEQYRGESEPRSDIYALAATLYHLATNDDPRSHPFDFPQAPQLGAFGQGATRRTELGCRPAQQVIADGNISQPIGFCQPCGAPTCLRI